MKNEAADESNPSALFFLSTSLISPIYIHFYGIGSAHISAKSSNAEHANNNATMVTSSPPLQIRADPSLIECGGTRNKSRSCSWNATGYVSFAILSAMQLALLVANSVVTRSVACSVRCGRWYRNCPTHILTNIGIFLAVFYLHQYSQYLASGSSDKFARLFTVDHVSAANVTNASSAAGGPVAAGTGRELQALTGHTAGVERVRFHPSEANILCSASSDRSVRLWDIRSASTSRSGGKIDVGAGVVSVEWHPGQPGSVRYLAVTDKNDTVKVYDARKLSKPLSAGFDLTKDDSSVYETHFSPSGMHLVSGVKLAENAMGALRVWKWDDSVATNGKGGKVVIGNDNSDVFVGHSGPMYAQNFSPDGTRLASGGGDALVSLWDVSSMTCQATVARRTKFIRSVSFTHDSRFVAIASEDDGVDIADSVSGAKVGLLKLMTEEKSRIRDRMGTGGVGGGADEVAFHPKAYVLACARGFDPPGVQNGPVQTPQITVARLALG